LINSSWHTTGVWAKPVLRLFVRGGEASLIKNGIW
jgi:hypothetical protein